MEIKIDKFVIESKQSEIPRQFILTGPFYFDSVEAINAFKEKLFELFGYYLDDSITVEQEKSLID